MKTFISNIFKILIVLIIFPVALAILAKQTGPYINSQFQFHLLFKFLFVGLFIFFIYLFIKNYILYYFYTETLPFPFTYPKRIVWEGMFLQSRHPLLFTYYGVILSIFGITNTISGLVFYLPIFVIISMIYNLYFYKKISLFMGNNYLDYRDEVPFFFRFKKPKVKSPHLSRLLAQLFFRIFYLQKNPTTYLGVENIPEKGGALFIANHLSYPDPFFVSGGIFRNIRFLTTAEVFKKKLNRLFFYLMGSIPIKRFTKDPVGIRKFFKVMQQGYAVGYFAEGQRSWTGEPSEFPKGVIRLLKKVTIPIVPVSIAGIYALWPRWANYRRKAKVQVRFHPPLQNIKTMTNQEFENQLKELLHSDEKNYTSVILSDKKLNSGLTNLLWRCPICGGIDKLIEFDEDKIECVNCNAHGTLTKDNQLIINEKKETFGFWYNNLKSFPLNIKQHQSKICELYLGNFPKIKKVDKGTLSFDTSKFKYNGKKEYVFNFSDIKQLHAEGGKTMHFITDKTQVQVKFLKESPLKWVAIYESMLSRSQK